MTEIEFQLSSYPPGLDMLPHVDACRRVSVVLAGSLLESHERRDSASTTGSVAIKSADCVHRTRFGPEGAEILSVLLPDPLLEALDLASDWRRWRWLHEGTPRRAALRFSLAAMRRDGVAAVSALGVLARDLREAAPARCPAAPRARIDAIRARLHDEPDRDLSVTEAAREAGLHPVTVGLQFRRAFGCSIRAYRQRLRAERAAIALLAPRAPLTAVALRHGFYDLSHLTRVFRREYGVPPGAFRRSLASAGPPLQSSKTTWVVAV
jgi:AraC-like DNA-binding protein